MIVRRKSSFLSVCNALVSKSANILYFDDNVTIVRIIFNVIILLCM